MVYLEPTYVLLSSQCAQQDYIKRDHIHLLVMEENFLPIRRR